MVRGRKPIPTARKRLNGNPGKRPLNHLEPKPAAIIPPCPDHLDEIAKAKWEWLTTRLQAIGLFGDIDADTAARYCVAYSRWVQAEKMVNEAGTVIFSDKGGSYQNPYLHVANRAWEQMQALVSEFGLSPSARSRMQVHEQEGQDKWSDFMSRAPKRKLKVVG